MQTEEIVPCAQPSLELDVSKFRQSGNNNNNGIGPLLDVKKFDIMAVKQEHNVDEDHNRSASSVSPSTQLQATKSSSEEYFKQLHINPPNDQQQPQLPQQESQINSSNVQTPEDAEIGSKTGRARRKARWKLKFHHQALPPEYLDHYEAALAQEALNTPPISTPSSLEPSLANFSTSSSTPTPPNADVHNWIQRIAAMQNDLGPTSLQSHFTLPNSNSCGKSTPVSRKSSSDHHHSNQVSSSAAHRPPMKYSDLPYMGEITLDNSKPRRGRKPKKADICHLIYKNYGTILPGTPGLQPEPQEVKNPAVVSKKPPPQPQLPISFQRTDLQNKIISSLLEKRLTQEKRGLRAQPEPLNLCVRDLNYLDVKIKNETSSDTEDENGLFVPRFFGSENSSSPSLSPRSKRNSTDQSQPPTKRKRSAIFIPPIPAESNNNATEVSICKFKFTGGAKPSLQEKKSLSVDSGGNFRYYSGTGDKSMRGYEFFPRESLSQQTPPTPPTPPVSSPPVLAQPQQQQFFDPMQQLAAKRKTRKSVQREKLEQTFKEKGFLIQTQQLESAEGATYCKFRQLRKFTRYLFRSWKDYLPENVSHQLTDAAGEPIGLRDPSDALVVEALTAAHRHHHGFELPKTLLEEPKSVPLT